VFCWKINNFIDRIISDAWMTRGGYE